MVVMESFRVGIFCLFSMSLSRGMKSVHEMRDAIHQVGYNYASWPSPGILDHEHVSQPGQPQPNDEVTILEQYHRVGPDGAVEFKLVLSDGQINHQKIYSKIVDGMSMQVYDGYYSVPVGDGSYRTTYYRADEKGYRLLGYDNTAPSNSMRIQDIDRMVQSDGRLP